MLETMTYWLALLIVVSLPPALLYWYLIHPFAAAWRRLGRVPTYVIVVAICLAVGYGLWRIREPLLAVRYGFNPWLTAVGAVLYLVAAYLELRCRKHLKLSILAGVPELSRGAPGKLLQDGIYGRIRHPRYLSLLLGLAGVALFLNYLTVYVIVVACVPALYLLVLFEERELRHRFGQAYADYARRVPRFIPRRPSPPNQV